MVRLNEMQIRITRIGSKPSLIPTKKTSIKTSWIYAQIVRCSDYNFKFIVDK